MNTIFIVGNVTYAPKKTKSVISLGLADNSRQKKNGTTFFNVILYNATDNMKWVLDIRKGEQIAVTGELFTASYKDKVELKLNATRICRLQGRKNTDSTDNEDVDISEGLDDLPL